MSTKYLFGALLAATLALAACERESHEADPHEDTHADEHRGESHDGQSIIPPDVAERVGIRTAAVGAGVIRDAHEVHGLLAPVEGRHARIRARFPGPVRAVRVGIGDTVVAGQVLAIVESNVSLSSYQVTAPFAGTVLDVGVGTGDLAGDEPLFELADLSALWVDLHLFGADAQHIATGLPVQVYRLSDGAEALTTLDRILPATATASQSTVARATLRNDDGLWRPGTAVRARVTVSQREAALVVPAGALQRYADATVVFVRDGDAYRPRRVRLGERDAVNAEVLEGLHAGETIVVEQSFTIKADLEKESSAHGH